MEEGSSKVLSLLEHSCSILISFKIVVIFNTTSADIKTMSADGKLEMTTILKEMRIMQLCSKSDRTLAASLKESPRMEFLPLLIVGDTG